MNRATRSITVAAAIVCAAALAPGTAAAAPSAAAQPPGNCVSFAEAPVPGPGPSLTQGRGEVHGCSGNVNVEVLVLQDFPTLPDRVIGRASGFYSNGSTTAVGPCTGIVGVEQLAYYTEVRINGERQVQSQRVRPAFAGCA